MNIVRLNMVGDTLVKKTSENSGGGDNVSTMEYLDVSGGGMASQICAMYANLWKYSISAAEPPLITRPLTGYVNEGSDVLAQITQIAIDFELKVTAYAGNTTTKTIREALIEVYKLTQEQLESIPRITKEEFYNIES